jgi:O-antigen/teichoic acid export membrane protein
MSDSIGKASVLTVVANWVLLPIGVLANVLLARALGPEIKGIYSVYLATQGLLLIPGYAVQTALTHFVANRRPDWLIFRRFTNRLALIQTIVSVGLLGALVQLPEVRAIIFGDLDLIYLVPLSLMVLATLWSFYRSTVLPGLQLYSKYTLWNTLSYLVSTGLLLAYLGVSLAAGISPDVTGIITVTLVGALVGSVGTWAIATAHVKIEQSSGFKNREIISIIGRFTAPVFSRNLVEWLNMSLGLYFVNAFAGPAQVGLYTVAIGLALQLWLIPFAVAGPLFARVSKEGDNAQSRETTRYAFRITLIMTVLLSSFTALVASTLIPMLYGPQFEGSVLLLFILLPGVVAIGPTRSISSYLAGIGQPGEPLRAELAGLCATVILGLLLVPDMGAVGAAWAGTASYFVYSAVLCYRFVRISESSWSNLLGFHRSDWARLKHRLLELLGAYFGDRRQRTARSLVAPAQGTTTPNELE